MTWGESESEQCRTVQKKRAWNDTAKTHAVSSTKRHAVRIDVSPDYLEFIVAIYAMH